MLKQKSIIALLLASLVLSTSLGAVMYKHFCGDALQEFALIKIDEHCMHHAEGQEMPACHQHPSDDMDTCCKTEKQALSTDDTQASTENKSSLQTGGAMVSVLYVLVSYLFSNPLDSQSAIEYSISEGPPIGSIQTFRVLFQQFIL